MSRSDKPGSLCTYPDVRKIFTAGGELFALRSDQIILLVADNSLKEVSLAPLRIRADDYII